MDRKHSLWSIVRSHYRTLNTWSSLAIQVAVPILVGVLTALPLLPFNWEPLQWLRAHAVPTWDTGFDAPLTVASILFGFFFAMAVFVFQLRADRDTLDPKAEVQVDSRAKPLVDELFYNCTYAVVITGVTAALSFALSLYPVLATVGGGSLLLGLFLHVAFLSMMCLRRLGAAYSHITALRSFDNWKPAKRKAQSK